MGREEQGLHRIDRVKLLLTGTAAGFLSAILGIGGGVILVTALVVFLRFDIKKAIGSSLATAIPVAFVGVLTHAILNISNIKIIPAVFVAIGSVVGARLGVNVMNKIKSDKLKKIFAILLFFVGLKLIGVVNLPTAAITQAGSYPLLVILGFAAGIASALFGIGGGIIMVPMFYLFFGLSMHEAVPTSLLVILPTTFVGAHFHKDFNNVNYGAVKLLVPVALAGAVVGALLCNILPQTALSVLFGIVMLLCSVRIFIEK